MSMSIVTLLHNMSAKKLTELMMNVVTVTKVSVCDMMTQFSSCPNSALSTTCLLSCCRSQHNFSRLRKLAKLFPF